MDGLLSMSAKERRRKAVFDEVLAGRLTIKAASIRLSLGYRQCRRSYARFVAQGDAGLAHRLRVASRGYSTRFREKVLRRYRERYAAHEVGPTLAAEKLAAEGLLVDRETLRRWLLAAGDWKKRRKRRARFGESAQMDGIFHPWFGPQGERDCLMNMVDDATSATMGLLDKQETTEAAMRLLWNCTAVLNGTGFRRCPAFHKGFSL